MLMRPLPMENMLHGVSKEGGRKEMVAGLGREQVPKWRGKE